MKKVLSLIFVVIFSSFTMPNEEKYVTRKIENIDVFDKNGNIQKLYSYLKNKPLLLCPVYTRCPSVCNMVSNGVKESVVGTEWLGKEFNVLTFSFDSSDTPKQLAFYEKRWKMDGVHWQTVSASYNNIQKLLKSIDFNYDYNSTLKEFNHPAIVIMISPQGRITRYIYGVTPKQRDIRLAATEAQFEVGKAGIVRGFWLKCFAFDPNSKTYKLDWSFLISTFAGLLMIGIICKIFFNLFISNKNS
jgi:protein SCO1/2